MKFKQLLTDDDAVSPVIGVILMVAITVILAAVIASFVLGLGDQQETAPNVSFNFDYDVSNDELTITKSGGDSVAGESVYIRGPNPDPGGWTANPGNDIVTEIGSGGNGDVSGVSGYTSGDIGAGQGILITNVGAAYEITLVYEDGDTSEELISDSGPDA